MKMIKNVTSKPTRMWIDGMSFIIKPNLNKAKKAKRITSDLAKIATLAANIVTEKTLEEKSAEKTLEDKSAEKTLEEKSPCQVMSTSSMEIVTEKPFEEKETWQSTSFKIIEKDNGKFYTQFHLPSFYYIKMGKLPNSPIEALQSSTNTEIEYPKFGKDGDILITGKNKEEICEARNEVHSIVSSIRDRATALQFIALPISSSEIHEKFENFKNNILAKGPKPGIHESIFVKTLKLHLTVVVFSLFDELEKAEAIKAFKDYKKEILKPLVQSRGSLKVKVFGVDVMDANPQHVNVLYAKAKLVEEDEDFNLQTFVNGISDYFYNRGLVRRYQDNVKVHMTLMNTKYSKVSSSPSKRWVKRKTFDATEILDEYKDYEFGTCDIEKICLALMSSEEKDGFYKSLSTISVSDDKD